MNLPDWIDRFHEAALDPSQWMVVRQELADATGSSRAELVGFGGPGFVSFTWVTSADEGLLQDFLSIGGGSPCANFRLAADDGHSILTVADERAYDRARKHLKRHDYLDFCEQHQMVFGCQTTLVRENNGLVGMSLLRSREDGRTDEAVQAIFASAAAAARTAVRMQRAIELRGHELLSGALEAFPAPCLLLDGFGQIGAASEAAERMIGASSVLALGGRHLCITDPGSSRRFDLALRSVLGIERRPHVRLAFGQSAMPELVLDLFRLPDRDWSLPFAARAMVMMRDPRAIRSGAAAELVSTFGLTCAEAEIVIALSSGSSRDEIADRRGVSVETLRSQLRSVYSKTGCSRETELVLLVKAFTD